MKLVLSFDKKKFDLRLYSPNSLIAQITFEDAFTLLHEKINSLLEQAQCKLSGVDNAAFLIGPGSFTSIKVVCCFFNALKLSLPQISLCPTRIDQAVYAIEGYEGCEIFMRCNSMLWHHYAEGEWKTVGEGEVFISRSGKYTVNELGYGGLPWPDIVHGIWLHSKENEQSKEARPFYGADLF